MQEKGKPSIITISESAGTIRSSKLDCFTLYNGIVYTPWEKFYGGVVIRGNILEQVFKGDPPQAKTGDRHLLIDCCEYKIMPGFVDIHVHGALGFDFTIASGKEGEKAIYHHGTSGGTTALVPTMVSAPIEHLKQTASNLSAIRKRQGPGSPEILGVHLEGPFLNPWYKGAHSMEYLKNPEAELIEDLAAFLGENLKILTLSPELPHALEAISYLKNKEVTVALGHSGASVEEVEQAVACGLRHVVHTFSAMRRFHHRSPGVLGAALTDDRLSAEIIADGVHTHPAAVDLFFRAKPGGKTVLVTDALAVCGLPGGECLLGDKKIIYRQGKAFLENGNLAGSVLTMNQALKGAVEMSGLSLEAVLPAATINPARVISTSKRKGSLETGKDADLVVLDDHYNVQATFCRGTLLTNNAT